MKIIKLVRDESFVRLKYITDGHLATEEHDTKFQEAPTKEFDDAFQFLANVAANILEVGSGYVEGMTIRSLTISRTKHGTKSVQIGFSKRLDAVDNTHRMATPVFQIDEPQDAEQSIRECSPVQAKQILGVIELAEAYLNGDRQQIMLPLVEREEDEVEGGADLLKE